mgnify:CR=1 FL=1
MTVHRNRPPGADDGRAERKTTMKKLIIAAMIAALSQAPATDANIYVMPGVYHANTETVTDIRGEEWGFDNEEIADGADVVITFDSVGTYDYTDDIITDIVEAK